MLTLTDDARLAIRTLLDPVDPAGGAGVRIAAGAAPNGEGPELTLTMAAVPEAGDQVVDDEGARVFLDPTAADLLDAQTLDVEIDSEARQVNFFLA